MPTEERQLAAIMFTDMVGYSAMAQRDEALALELLEEHRCIVREVLVRFHGTEIKTIGDAFLLQFRNALEVVQCALEIQRTFAKRNHDVARERRIELKIGIHLGDVVHRDGDVSGDGVNIASRIEALAGPGEICISEDIERQVRSAVASTRSAEGRILPFFALTRESRARDFSARTDDRRAWVSPILVGLHGPLNVGAHGCRKRFSNFAQTSRND